MKLKNKVAIVTGGARGIGKAICLQLAKEGAKIVIFDLMDELALKVAEEIRKKGGECLAIPMDVTSICSVEQAVEKVIDKFKRVDILVNNAGITKDKLILRMKEEDWDKVIQVNLKGAFNCLKVVLKFMSRQRYGRIVNISSVIGLRGNVGQANYAASKAGLIALTKSAAKEFARRGITVNAIAPGFIQTSMTQKLLSIRKDLLNQIPLGRVGKPEEVAGLVSYLVSEDVAYITGETVRIDGGMSM
ncbi:3-oxoacyl-[acyl-carrier-protein] reductase [Patescibacteria group bacterium]|nr:3-oxoacyl-[acyl-carrier-protein] reductase [Patescibacteria group bacterium]